MGDYSSCNHYRPLIGKGNGNSRWVCKTCNHLHVHGAIGAPCVTEGCDGVREEVVIPKKKRDPKLWYCSYCGTGNPKDHVFCQKEACWKPRPEDKPSSWDCGWCKGKNPGNMVLCTKCDTCRECTYQNDKKATQCTVCEAQNN